jgi:parvulin-like peptidyl-prolyl isomerase
MFKQNDKTLINKSCKFAALIFFAYVFVFCNGGNKPPEEFVAQVNNEYLLNAQLNHQAPKFLDPESRFSLKKELITEWVNKEIFYQAALSEGQKLNDWEQYQVESYRKDLLIRKYLNHKMRKDFPVSDRDIENYYEEHKEEFKRSEEEVHVVHLLIENRDRAIFNEISKTESLQAIIEKYYFNEKSTEIMPNGDLGYIPVSSLPNTFIRRIKKMKTGSVSSAIKTDNGYHFLQLNDWAKKGTYKSIDIVEKQIKFRLIREKRETYKQNLLETLKSEAQVQTYLSKIKDQVK